LFILFSLVVTTISVAFVHVSGVSFYIPLRCCVCVCFCSFAFTTFASVSSFVPFVFVRSFGWSLFVYVIRLRSDRCVPTLIRSGAFLRCHHVTFFCSFYSYTVYRWVCCSPARSAITLFTFCVFASCVRLLIPLHVHRSLFFCPRFTLILDFFISFFFFFFRDLIRLRFDRLDSFFCIRSRIFVPAFYHVRFPTRSGDFRFRTCSWYFILFVPLIDRFAFDLRSFLLFIRCVVHVVYRFVVVEILHFGWLIFVYFSCLVIHVDFRSLHSFDCSLRLFARWFCVFVVCRWFVRYVDCFLRRLFWFIWLHSRSYRFWFSFSYVLPHHSPTFPLRFTFVLIFFFCVLRYGLIFPTVLDRYVVLQFHSLPILIRCHVSFPFPFSLFRYLDLLRWYVVPHFVVIRWSRSHVPLTFIYIDGYSILHIRCILHWLFVAFYLLLFDVVDDSMIHLIHSCSTVVVCDLPICSVSPFWKVHCFCCSICSGTFHFVFFLFYLRLFSFDFVCYCFRFVFPGPHSFYLSCSLTVISHFVPFDLDFIHSHYCLFIPRCFILFDLRFVHSLFLYDFVSIPFVFYLFMFPHFRFLRVYIAFDCSILDSVAPTLTIFIPFFFLFDLRSFDFIRSDFVVTITFICIPISSQFSVVFAIVPPLRCIPLYFLLILSRSVRLLHYHLRPTSLFVTRLHSVC